MRSCKTKFRIKVMGNLLGITKDRSKYFEGKIFESGISVWIIVKGSYKVLPTVVLWG